MNVTQALLEIAKMAAALGSLAESISAASTLIAKVQADGRTELSDEEWSKVVVQDDAARNRLVEGIEAAQ